MIKTIAIYFAFIVSTLGVSVSFEWDKADGADYYLLVAQTNGGSWSIQTTNTFHQLTGLVPGVEHTFQVFGVNQWGTGEGSDTLTLIPSDQVVIETPPLLPPKSIEFAGLLINTGNQWSLQIKWGDVTNATKYLVELIDSLGNPLFSAETTARSAQVQKLKFDETNQVSVVSIDETGNKSERSAPMIVNVKRKSEGAASIHLNATIDSK